MAVKRNLPVPSVVIADTKAASIRKDVQAALQGSIEDSIAISPIGSPQYIECRNAKELKNAFATGRSVIEPCVLITDSIGELVLRENKHRFPNMKVIFYTQSVSPEKLVEFSEEGLISVSIRKGKTDRLRERFSQLYLSYWNSMSLRSFRHYIQFESDNPSRKCYYDEEKSRWLNSFDIYDEMRAGSPLGNRLAEYWMELQTLTAGNQ